MTLLVIVVQISEKIALLNLFVRAPDSINGDGSGAAASGADIIDSYNFEMTQGT